MVTLSFTIFSGQKNYNRAHMLFQVLCGFEPIFYTTHPNEESKNVDNEGYTFVLSEDYKELQVFANKDGKLSEFQADITNLVYAIEIIQLFSGADDWNVVITVTNTENGVEIAKANYPKEMIRWQAITQN